jgi:hypothetical protein
MAMDSFVPHFREATFCGVPSCVSDKSGCAASEKSLRNTALYTYHIFYLIYQGHYARGAINKMADLQETKFLRLFGLTNEHY